MVVEPAAAEVPSAACDPGIGRRGLLRLLGPALRLLSYWVGNEAAIRAAPRR